MFRVGKKQRRAIMNGKGVQVALFGSGFEDLAQKVCDLMNNNLKEHSMNISKEGIKLIHKYEQFRNNPYIDAVGVPTIGWGNTFWEDGTKVKMSDAPITRKRGDELNLFWLKKFEKVVLDNVKTKLNQCQFDALVSFVYNVGAANFKASTLLKRINNDPNDPDIKNQFVRWNKGRVKGRLTVLRGLTRRRNEEAYLYFKCNI